MNINDTASVGGVSPFSETTRLTLEVASGWSAASVLRSGDSVPRLSLTEAGLQMGGGSSVDTVFERASAGNVRMYGSGASLCTLDIGPSSSGVTDTGGRIALRAGGGKYWYSEVRGDSHPSEAALYRLNYYDSSSWHTPFSVGASGVGINTTPQTGYGLYCNGDVQLNGTTSLIGALAVDGIAYVAGAVNSTGAGAGYYFWSRTVSGNRWAWYTAATDALLYNHNGTSGTTAFTLTRAGDISSAKGTFWHATNFPLSTATPSTGDALKWNGSQWAPATDESGSNWSRTLLAWVIATWNGSSWSIKSSSGVDSLNQYSVNPTYYTTINFASSLSTSDYVAESAVARQGSDTGYFINAYLDRSNSDVDSARMVFAGTGNVTPPTSGDVLSIKFWAAA